MRNEFFGELAEAVRFGKQRNRNIIKRMNGDERGRRQRLRSGQLFTWRATECKCG